jgi:hypothetical protein
LKAAFILTIVAAAVLSYESKQWRIKWMEWRRNRLAAKLVETQERLEVLSLQQYDYLDDLPFVNNPIHFTELQQNTQFC